MRKTALLVCLLISSSLGAHANLFSSWGSSSASKQSLSGKTSHETLSYNPERSSSQKRKTSKVVPVPPPVDYVQNAKMTEERERVSRELIRELSGFLTSENVKMTQDRSQQLEEIITKLRGILALDTALESNVSAKRRGQEPLAPSIDYAEDDRMMQENVKAMDKPLNDLGGNLSSSEYDLEMAYEIGTDILKDLKEQDSLDKEALRSTRVSLSTMLNGLYKSHQSIQESLINTHDLYARKRAILPEFYQKREAADLERAQRESPMATIVPRF